jgi:hypothetical protein
MVEVFILLAIAVVVDYFWETPCSWLKGEKK